MASKRTTPTEVQAHDLDKSFAEHLVLRDVDLTIPRGQIVALVGASGTGKTVLLDILTGLLKPDAGVVMVCDHSKPDKPMVNLHTLEWEQLDNVRLHWAIVFQRNALFSGTVYENIALWLQEHTEMDEGAIDARVRESLKAAALNPDDVMEKTREELSGGMAKRVAIARAIAVDPAVIFYDEPTTGLDPMISAQIHELIFNLHHRSLPDGSKRTTIFVTHDKDLLRRVQPRIVMLHDARVCFDGSYEDFGKCPFGPAQIYFRSMPVLHNRPVAAR